MECDWDDYATPECYIHQIRKAAKEHKCCECRGVIRKGENYHVHSGIWEGEPARYKRCADCQAFACELECVPFRGLNEEVMNREQQFPGLRAKWEAIRSLRRPHEKP